MTTDLTVVIGATGRQGGAVAPHLLAAAFRVRAVVRDPDSPRAQPVASAGAELVRGDLRDASSLQRAFRGASTVFSVENFWEKGAGADAAAGQREACVMPNKGPYIVDAVEVLDDILAKTGAVQDKARTLLRRIHSWDAR